MLKYILLISLLSFSCNDSLVKESTCAQVIKHISECVLNRTDYLIYISDKDQFCSRPDLDIILSMSCEDIKKDYF